ncbi:MAG: hypothetical protein QHJ82_14120 [Verrucomicrobiota bacterium]|nr:hypothetical protein [Verrucomicrobiota bacterium]
MHLCIKRFVATPALATVAALIVLFTHAAHGVGDPVAADASPQDFKATSKFPADLSRRAGRLR